MAFSYPGGKWRYDRPGAAALRNEPREKFDVAFVCGRSGMAQLISFAQNQEDVLLWRSLGTIEEGFFIDVGAAHPSEYSVTKLFSEHGWRGINVEPNKTYFALLAKERPRDVNLQICLAAESGERVFYEVDGTGLSTLDVDVAHKQEANGWSVRERRVPARTLAEVCAEHRPDGPIHFLKIDVEGGEREVLEGADFGRFRPWIILVEATEPGTQTVNHEKWEPLLLEAGYDWVWFDGLNRYYIAHEWAEALAPNFKVQLNVFDGFPRAVDMLEALERAKARADLEQQKRERAEAGQQAALAALEESGSRRATAELAHRNAEQENQALAAALQVAEARFAGAQEIVARIEAILVGVPGKASADAAQIEALTQRLLMAEHIARVHEAASEAYRRSSSWRLTRPLRALAYLMRGQIGIGDIVAYVLHRRPPQIRNLPVHPPAAPPGPTGVINESAPVHIESSDEAANEFLSPRTLGVRRVLSNK